MESMKKKVLILGVASVQLDAILQLKKMGYEVHACAMSKDGPGADCADYFSEINILDKEAVINYIKDYKISLVYSVGSDLAMPIASAISEQLNMPKFVSERTAKICNNKDLMRTTLGNEFKGNVKFQVVRDEKEEAMLDYPFIVKPSDSQGQRGVALVNNVDEYLESFKKAKAYSRSGLVILEQYISGPEISVNGYVVNGEIKFLAASDRNTWPEYTGLIHKHILPSKEITNHNYMLMEEIIKKSCEKLEIINGPVYAQMKIENGEPYIIEITPRLDGCHMWNILERYTGVNLLNVTFQHLLDDNISELDKHFEGELVGQTLEFICQQPNTKADYSMYKEQIKDSLDSFKYYEQGDTIRPVNGKLDKIGYIIYNN